MTYVHLNKKYGVRTSADFFNPKVGLGTEFTFPKASVLWHIGNYKSYTFSTTNTLIENLKAPLVYVAPNYEKPNGKFVRTNLQLNKIINVDRKLNKGFIYTKEISKAVDVSLQRTIIMNYGHLSSMFKYKKYIAADLDKYSNTIRTMVSDISKDLYHRINYIDIEVPDVLKTSSEYKQMILKGERYIANNINTHMDYIIVELLKFLSPETRVNSAFKGLEKVDNANTCFIFRHGTKFTIITLENLLSLDKDNSMETVIAGFQTQKARSVFLYWLLMFISRSTELVGVEDKLDKTDIGDHLTSISKKNSVVEEVDDIETHLDALIETHNKTAIIEPVNVAVELNPETIFKDTPKELGLTVVNTLKDKGTYSKNALAKLEEAIASVDIEEVNLEEYVITEDETKLPDNDMVVDKEMLKSTLEVKNKKYIEKHYEKDIKRMMAATVNIGLPIVKHEITKVKNAVEDTEIHEMEIMQHNGRVIKFKRIIPALRTDGTIYQNGTSYKVTNQKADRPIRKINNATVALSSNYGKIMITRGATSNVNISKALNKQFKDNDNIRMVVSGEQHVRNKSLPYWYTRIANATRSFVIHADYVLFDYTNRDTILVNNDKLDKIETDGQILIGKSKDGYITLKDEEVFIGKSKTSVNILTFLQINVNDLPLEHTSIRVGKHRLPLGLVLIYYVGLDTLLQLEKIKHRISTDINEKIDGTEYRIRLSDKSYIFNKRDVKGTLLLGGIVKMDTKYYSSAQLQNSDGTRDILADIGVTNRLFVELDLWKQMFIDPITKDVLKLIKEPTAFTPLLLRANELLVTDDNKSINDISGLVFKGPERLAGMVYNANVKEIKKYLTSMNPNAKLTFDPYAIKKTISEDSVILLEEDMNPITNLKQSETVTFTGFLGRSKEAIDKASREHDVSEVGIMSEATKESSDVGITATFSASPVINNMLGITDGTDKINPTNIYSTSTLLAPMSTHDDGKRMLFNSVQNAHVVPMVNQKVLPIRTGYESVLGLRVSDKYVITAKNKGIVKKVTKNTVIISYGVETEKYKLRTWFSRPEGGVSYKHELVSNVVEGQRVKEGDALVYDNAFFSKDIFSPAHVVYKTGILAYTALVDDFGTHEDSAIMNKNYSSEMAADIVKVKSVIIHKDDLITECVNVGDKVEYNDALIINVNAGDLDNEIGMNMTEKTKALLKEEASVNVKAKVKGAIGDIVVYYNIDKEEANKELLELIEDSDKRLEHSTGYTGRVTDTYSVEAKPLLEGEIEIKFFIVYRLNMGNMDKGVIQNQLKFTVGIEADDITSVSGKQIDILFNTDSMEARNVESVTPVGTTNTLLVKLTEDIVGMYDE